MKRYPANKDYFDAEKPNSMGEIMKFTLVKPIFLYSSISCKDFSIQLFSCFEILSSHAGAPSKWVILSDGLFAVYPTGTGQ